MFLVFEIITNQSHIKESFMINSVYIVVVKIYFNHETIQFDQLNGCC